MEQDTPYFPETADVDSVPEYTEEDLTKRDPLLANILRRSQGELYTQNDRELQRESARRFLQAVVSRADPRL